MPSIPLPTSFSEETQNAHQSVFTIEPLYPGYGTTLGNAIRRVLLSSLPGAAITAVSIEGVTHEFSTLPYVKEDVVDILLNLKQVRFFVEGEGPWNATIHTTGETAVTAADFKASSGVKVVNLKQTIATLTDKAAKLTIEATIDIGRGYVPTENREKEKLPIGTIAIDSIFTPIRNVNFSTEHVRVEQMTNYDKLKLDITTDGTVEPADALRQAVQILVDQFQHLLQSPSDTSESGLQENIDQTSETETSMTPSEESNEPEKSKKKTTRKKKSDE